MTPSPNIFVSTGAFQSKTFRKIIDVCLANHICQLELSSGVEYSNDLSESIHGYAASNGLKFLLHNYFPPPRAPFVLNLASNDDELLYLSRRHCKRAIELCAKLGIPFYSVHAGFCFHAHPRHLGKQQTGLQRISFHDAEQIFIESIRNLSQYASTQKIKIAIENNPLAIFNRLQGGEQLYLGITADDILRLLHQIGGQNVFLLLDVGHLKVTSQSLKIDPAEFIRMTAPHTIAVHLSENDGQSDCNMAISRKSWFWEPLKQYLPPDLYYVLEAYNLSPEEIKDQLSLISNNLNSER